jgi:predicted  nucleic acid-binding Zn-ribbon protein
MSDADRAEFGYTEWRCTNCGHGVPKNNPPCDRCGNMEFEQVEVRESDFDAEVRGASNRELLRENWWSVGGGLAILLVVAVAALASAGVFVVSDPLGLGYRYGAVDAVQPNADGTLTAAELHGRVAANYSDTAMSWNGRTLQVSFRSDASSNDQLTEDVVQVATWYADYVGDGGDAATFQITVQTGDGRARATVDRADAAAFAAGDISESTYRSRIFERS